MPEGLLRGGEPDTGRTDRHWLVLPLSIAAHAGAAIAMIIIPLAAAVELPQPHRSVAPYMRVTSVQPIEVPAPKGVSQGPAQSAPVTAPSFISEPSDAAPAPTGSPAGDFTTPGIPSGAIGGLGPIGSLMTGEPPVPPAPPAIQRNPVPVGGVISAPRKTHHVAPVYPDMALKARVEGTVILEAVINERGGIERLRVLRSVALLDAAAIDAVSGWRYSPTTLNNVAVPVLMTITVTFSLRN